MHMTIELPSPDAAFRIGTRGSPLALAQAHETRERLAQAFDLPFEAFTIVVIKVTGDQILDKPLREIDGKGLFTREIEEALLTDDIDIAVHSTKDMPVAQPGGLVMDCFLPREDVRDAFVSLKYKGLSEMPKGAIVGTSSTRRRAQLAATFPHLKVVEFRGNVQTRLMKLEKEVADATFLATAGLKRLGMDDVPYYPIDPEDMLPAIAQGAIGIERRASDDRAAQMLAAIDDRETGLRLTAERSLLAALDGSCETPIGGLAILDGRRLHLRGEIIREDGSEVISDDQWGDADDAAIMGTDMGRKLLEAAGPGFFPGA
jgi:hydroxymethylbilane synthase